MHPSIEGLFKRRLWVAVPYDARYGLNLLQGTPSLARPEGRNFVFLTERGQWAQRRQIGVTVDCVL